MEIDFDNIPPIQPGPTQFRTLRQQYGTQADVAWSLGVSERMIRMAETEADYPRRVLLSWAVCGLLLNAGKPIDR